MLAAGLAHAQEFWIGRPTVGDYLRHSLEGAVRSAAEYNRAAGAFEAEIAAARRDYFKAQASDKVAKGEKFGELLFAKDLMLATFLLSGGFTQQTTATGGLLAALNGGREIDGGIRPSARPAFDNWVRAMRTSMGAKSDDAMLILSPDRLRTALIETAPEFEKYRRERDLVESRMERGFSPLPTEIQGQRPLREPSREMSIADVAGRAPRHPRGLDEEVGKVDAAKYPILVCEYGPSYNENGREYFGAYYFWKRSAPPNIARLLAYDNLQLGLVRDRVLGKCPQSETQAMELVRAPIRVTISEALRQEVRDDIARRELEARKPREAAVRPSAPLQGTASRPTEASRMSSTPVPGQPRSPAQTPRPAHRPNAQDRHVEYVHAQNACMLAARKILSGDADQATKKAARAERDACIRAAKQASRERPVVSR